MLLRNVNIIKRNMKLTDASESNIMKVVTPNDFGDTIVMDPQTKKYNASSQVLFNNDHATVDLLLNGMQLLFRGVYNSNRTMLCTGVRYNGVWYGDAPNNEGFSDPFNGTTSNELRPIGEVYAKRHQNEVFESLDLGDYRFKTKKITMQAPTFKQTTTVDTGIPFDKYISISAKVKLSENEYEMFNTISYKTVKGSTLLTIENLATVRFNDKEMTLFITYEPF